MKPLITDQHLFPRSEYYTRFEGTTAFAMDEPAYWGTYHRSESSRMFDVAGGRQASQFSSPCLVKAPGVHSFFAHTGGYHSPFTIEEYAEALKVEKRVPIGKKNVRDHLLLYKNKMATQVVESFEEIAKNKQTVKIKRKTHIRPIVYTENDYPCVLVALPILNSSKYHSEAATYWRDHPKPFQRLLLCSFIAFLNVEAMNAGIPIEMVLRASFGHNNPSVCETNNTFRINVGSIPACYAELIGKALDRLNDSINEITDEESPDAPFDDVLLSNVNKYNVHKLKQKITEKPRYKKLINTDDYKNAHKSAAAFTRLYDAFCKINKIKNDRKGSATFTPVDLSGKKVWQAIRQAGDCMSKSLLDECFRQKGTEDWFINQLMNAILGDHLNPIETALTSLLKLVSYKDKVTMRYKKIHEDLKKPKRRFKNPSFKKIYAADKSFSDITSLLCEALLIEKPDQALYAELEHGGANLFSTYRASIKLSDEPDFGSDSEFSDDLTDTDVKKKKTHIVHKKLRVCAGMKAILAAHHGALTYFDANGLNEYHQDASQMYYEVEPALPLVAITQEMQHRKEAEGNGNILHFDLNHCNATNNSNQQLTEKLEVLEPRIIILDYTSSTMHSIKGAMQQCFAKKTTELVILVDSGLKNNQGGLDYNPYGEIRVCGRNRKNVKDLFNFIQSGLSKQDRLAPKAHEMVRVCKNRGLAVSLKGFFKTTATRFQAVPSEPESEKNKHPSL